MFRVDNAGIEPCVEALTTGTLSRAHAIPLYSKLYDLLEPKSTDLPVREDQHHNIVVPNLAQETVASYAAFAAAYAKALNNRHVAATNLNAHSSRSHAVLTIKVRISTDSILSVAPWEPWRQGLIDCKNIPVAGVASPVPLVVSGSAFFF